MSSAPPPPPSSSTQRSPPRKRARTMPNRQTPPAAANPRSAAALALATDAAALQSIGTPAVQIDASQGEGGGQILRTALALSAVLDRSVELRNIRGGRAVPGLQAQHLEGTKLIAKLAGAKQAGVRLMSRTVTMGVGDGYQGEVPLEAAVATAGATSLILQAALPVMLRRLGEGELLHLTGGTCCLFAPTSEYVRHVLVPNLRVFGLDIKYEVVKHGFYPKGGGKVKVQVEKKGCVDGCLRPLWLTTMRGVLSIEGSVVVCGREYVERGVVEAIIRGAVRVFADPEEQRDVLFPSPSSKHFSVEDATGENASGKCISLTLYATTKSGLVVGSSTMWTEKEAEKRVDTSAFYGRPKSERQKWQMWRRTATEMGAVAAHDLIRTLRIRADFDKHMADQMIIFMAMAKGASTAILPQPTKHVRSVIDTCRKFGVQIDLRETGNICRINVEGEAIKIVESTSTSTDDEVEP